jgi:hypothetical protein
MRLLTTRARLIVTAASCLCLFAAGQAVATPTADSSPDRVPAAPLRTVPSGNLIQNPGAEQGTGGDLPSWDTTPGFIAELYGAEFRPGTEISQQIAGGAHLFGGGSEADVSYGSQVIDLSSAASEIDSGAVIVRLAAFLGGIDDEGDYAEVSATFLPATGDQPLAEPLRIGPVTAADRGFVTKLLPRSREIVMPKQTRRILVTITSTRAVGIYTDGYADNLSLTLRTRTVTVNTSVTGIKSPGRRVQGKLSVTAPCKAGRTVTIKKGSKVLGKKRTTASGRFSIKTKKHKKGKLTVKVRKRTVGTTTCAAITKKVPGRN